MHRERLADDIYIFRSRQYAEVNCGVILTGDGAVLIDTLFYPDETLAVKQFIEERHSLPVTYLINTHYHADHTTGNFLFPGIPIVAHTCCAELLKTRGREGLQQMRESDKSFAGVEVVLPRVLLEKEEMVLQVGRKSLLLQHRPGHSPDLITVTVQNQGIMFASDAVMPIPTFFDGSFDESLSTLEQIKDDSPNLLVQGHGPILLQGEVQNKLQENITYLQLLEERVSSQLSRSQPGNSLENISEKNAEEISNLISLISIEDCGKSREMLFGLATDLHRANCHRLYENLSLRESV